MERDDLPEGAAWLATQDFRDTLPTATIMPPQSADLDHALDLLGQMAGRSLQASVQLRPGALIAEGGMGVVREAEQVALGRTVAIKTLRADKRDPSSVRDLLREAWVTGSLEHPNVVPVHHLGVDGQGLPALVLKRVEGVEWSKLMHDAAEVARRFGTTDLLAWNLDILLHVLNGIRFAHSRGIIHRDLKPSNVMIGDFGEVYVLDWGVALSLRDDRSGGLLPRAKDAKHIAGTPCYMAPEMLQLDQPLSERTDVYLAGAVLFEIIAGRPPHAGTTAVAVMTSVLTSRPELPPNTPSELAAICMRAMDPDPARRFESADALRIALQAYIGHRGSELLAARAMARLAELRLALAGENRDEIYRLFSACRFGFHEALASWRENLEATRGLAEATLEVARYELAQGDAQAALKLIGELAAPDDALLAEARRAADEQASRRKRLEELGQAHDLAIGRRARAWMGFVIGLFFALLPLVPQARMLDHRRQFLSTLAVVGAIAVAAWLFRSVLGSTLVNRRLLAGILLIFVGNSVLVGAGWMMGIAPIHMHVLMVFLYFISASMLALTVDSHLLPTALGFAGAFLFAARYPEYWMYAKSAGAFIFAMNVLWAWLLPTKK